jgi:hypothetical protein
MLTSDEITTIFSRANYENLVLTDTQLAMLHMLLHADPAATDQQAINSPVHLYVGQCAGSTTLWALIQRSLAKAVVVVPTAHKELYPTNYVMTPLEFSHKHFAYDLVIFELGGFPRHQVNFNDLIPGVQDIIERRLAIRSLRVVIA